MNEYFFSCVGWMLSFNFLKFDWMNFIGIGYGNESSMNEVFVVEVFNFDN